MALRTPGAAGAPGRLRSPPDSTQRAPHSILGGRQEGRPVPVTASVPTVYCCCCLANISLPGIGGTVPESKPFFYVNVADIESLEVEVSYVACE